MCISLTTQNIYEFYSFFLLLFFFFFSLRYWARIIKKTFFNIASLYQTWCNSHVMASFEQWNLSCRSSHGYQADPNRTSTSLRQTRRGSLQWKCKNCISRKWRRREETLLLFFFMRPMSLMLEAKLLFFHPETSPADLWRVAKRLATLYIFLSFIFFLFFRWWNRTRRLSFPLPVSQKTKNLMMHLHDSAPNEV